MQYYFPPKFPKTVTVKVAVVRSCNVALWDISLYQLSEGPVLLSDRRCHQIDTLPSILPDAASPLTLNLTPPAQVELTALMKAAGGAGELVTALIWSNRLTD